MGPAGTNCPRDRSPQGEDGGPELLCKPLDSRLVAALLVVEAEKGGCRRLHERGGGIHAVPIQRSYRRHPLSLGRVHWYE